MRRAGLGAVACFLFACGANYKPGLDKPGLDENRLSYIRLAVALGEHDPNSLDYYYGPPEWVAEIRAHTPKLTEIKKAALDLIARVQSRPGNDYLAAQLQALAKRVELLQGVRPKFDQEARELFGVEALPVVKRGRMEAIRNEIGSLLPGNGTLVNRYAAFDQKFVIPEDKVAAIMERALQGCRERALEHLHLPAEEAIKVEYVSNRPWNAYSRYQGHYQSLVQINADFALTVDRALQLACHEGYPGHHAYNTIQDVQLVQREGRLELMVQPAFSPQSLVSEALATYAVDVAFPPADRLQFERDVLFPIAGFDQKNAATYLRVSLLVDELEAEEPGIARDFLDGKLEWARAASALEDKALMAHTDATLKYLNEFRTYMLTYTVGKDMARNCVTRAGADRWQVYEKLITWQLRLRDCAS